MDADRAHSRSGVEARRAAASFAKPIRSQGVLQLLTSFGPFIAACAAMYLVYPISLFLTLTLAVPTGLLLVRVFIVLHWLTGNIGFHHIDHLNARVPNYRFSAAHAAVQALWSVKPLSLMGGLRASWLTLWDEERKRLVTFPAATNEAA